MDLISMRSAIIALLLAAISLSVAGEDRVALVIGNSAYKEVPLDNPINDARAISRSLNKLGFTVTTLENGSLEQMYEATAQFGNDLRDRGGVGLFYYAGHGVQVDGRNYLLPVDAVIRTEEEIRYKTLDAGMVLDKMQAANNPLNVVILDACRDNPFKQRSRSVSVSGLAQMDAPVGSLIAFATAPGAPASDGMGSNSVYTEALLRYIETPDLPVEELFKRVRSDVRIATEGMQIPWESTSLEKNFYFGANSGANKTIQIADHLQGDHRAWEAVALIDSIAGYQAYLELHPDGAHAQEARKFIGEMSVPKDRTFSAPGTSTSTSTSTSTITSQDISGPVHSQIKGRSGPTKGFSFSAEEEKEARLWDASKNAFEDALVNSCALGTQRTYTIDLGEYYRVRAPGGGKSLEGSFEAALEQRLSSAGFISASANGPRVSGAVTGESAQNRLLSLNEVSLTTALILSDSNIGRLGNVVGRSETYSAADDTIAMVELISKEADQAAAQIIKLLCSR